uniref:Uncharacterized protein n=1 Tax=Anguilla anguilla TaxID=7936 RepID=A0A0E9PX39_ANGAN
MSNRELYWETFKMLFIQENLILLGIYCEILKLNDIICKYMYTFNNVFLKT